MSDQKCRLCEKHAAEKPSWGPGPWKNEPERAEWVHAGLPCIAHRGASGSWCGYVGLAPGHPAHGKDYNDVSVDVHGGLTYAEPCAGCVCHIPKPGEPDNLFWLGFDCAHAYDLSPSIRAHLDGIGRPACCDDEHYWTLAEVQDETNSLAEQLAAMV